MTGGSVSRRIVFRCDANDTIGGGHAMRCLTLANALAEQGAGITFVAASMPAAMEQRIVGAGHEIERIPFPPELQREGSEWENPPLSAEVQMADAMATSTVVGRADWTIVDHYLLDAHWHSTARSFAEHLLVIDDLANRSFDCDVLLDQTFGRSVDDYSGLVPSGAKVLAGSTYALLRPEFARERPAALARRQTDSAARRILISMGTGDPNGITAWVLERVLGVAPECAVDVVLGPQANSLESVRKLAAINSGISVHVDSDRMAELMRNADIAIGAAGTTSWERCCLGLPSIAVVLAENQSLIAGRLAAVGAHFAITGGDEQALTEQLQLLLASSETRAQLAKAATNITDGLGSTRVCAAMDSMIAYENHHE